MNRASDLLGAAMENITAKPLEQFPDPEEEMPTAEDVEYKGVLTQYYGFVSIFASISVVLIAVSVWIMLQ